MNFFLQISKGVIERKRRARINRSLAELKFMILSESSDKSLHSKLDKAEILERTLQHIQTLQKQQHQPSPNFSRHPAALDLTTGYSNGYFACVTEVDRFLAGQNVNESARLQITNHLALAPDRLSQPEVCQTLPGPRTFSTTSPAPYYAVVPASPSPSTFSVTSSSSGSSSDSRLSSPFSTAASEGSVWRPW